jgi:hypothetical protein
LQRYKDLVFLQRYLLREDKQLIIEKEEPRYRLGHLSNPPEEDFDFDDEIDLWDWDSIEEDKEYYIDDEGNEYDKEDEDLDNEDL